MRPWVSMRFVSKGDDTTRRLPDVDTVVTPYGGVVSVDDVRSSGWMRVGRT